MTGEPEIRTVESPDDMAAIVTVLQQVWGTTTPIVNVELLRAFAHSGGYVAGVYDGDRPLGGSFGFLARHHGETALHSHVTGILPAEVHEVVGSDRRTQLHRFITAMVETIADTGTVALREPEAEALAVFRSFNYERIYLRPEAVEQADLSARLIGSLAEFYLTHPSHLPDPGLVPGSPEATAAAVRYVSGMTDRFAHRAALDLLGWDQRALPRTA